MSYKNRLNEYNRLMDEAKGLKKKDKYHKIPAVLMEEFGNDKPVVEEPVVEEPVVEEPVEEVAVE